jgi:hypothetical protein
MEEAAMPKDKRKTVDLRPLVTGHASNPSAERRRPFLETQSLLVFGAVGLAGAVTLGLAVFSSPAKAVSSFTRQTGQPCATCHTAFPELTPTGRRFKLNGYTITGGMEPTEAPPISATVLPTFTKTKVQQDTPPTNPDGYPIAHVNDNFILQSASLFYAGKIYDKLGAFIQATYDKAEQHTFLDDTDIRYTHTVTRGPVNALFGLNVNNGPTVQDVWNTTPAWGFPYVASTIAPAFKPPLTQVEEGWDGRSVGTGAYVFLNDMLYLEAAAYHNLSKGEIKALGLTCPYNSDYIQNVKAWAELAYPNATAGLPWQPYALNRPFSIACASNSLASASPYWRVALEKVWGEHSLMIGAFGFYPQVLPGRVMGYGVDQYRDIGWDAQYQWINDKHAVTLQVTRISEKQNLRATYTQGIAAQVIDALGIVNAFGVPPVTGNASSNAVNYLTSFKASAGYVWDRTISGTVGYFHVTGSPDATLYGNAVLNPGMSAVGLPNGSGLIFDAAYMPFSKGGPEFWPWANARIGLSYTHYLSLFGGTTNFDGKGTYFNGSSWRSHTATDNNTLFLYTWTAF